MRARLVAIGILDAAVLALSYWLESFKEINTAVVSWGITAVGLLTFLGALSANDVNTKVTTRFALTAAVSVVWFSVVGALLFYKGDEGPLADQAFQTVSFVMGVVVAFYFGAQAYQAVGQAKASGGSGSTAGGGTTGGSAIESRGGPGTGEGSAKEVWD